MKNIRKTIRKNKARKHTHRRKKLRAGASQCTNDKNKNVCLSRLASESANKVVEKIGFGHYTNFTALAQAEKHANLADLSKIESEQHPNDPIYTTNTAQEAFNAADAVINQRDKLRGRIQIKRNKAISVINNIDNQLRQERQTDKRKKLEKQRKRIHDNIVNLDAEMKKKTSQYEDAFGAATTTENIAEEINPSVWNRRRP
jgi:hypothetical protein